MTRSFSRACWLALALMGGVLPVLARLPGEYITQVRPERYRTPCRPFAADYAHGPLKVLFFASSHVAAREIAELHQRFNITFDATLYTSPPNTPALADDSDVYTGAIQGTSTAEKLEVLARQLTEHWDAFVVGENISFDLLPLKVQYQILRQVADGAGLIVMSPIRKEVSAHPTNDAPEQILAGVPFPLLTSYAPFIKVPLDKVPADALKTYTFGTGRVAFLKHYTAGWPKNPEGYWQGFHALTPAIRYSYQEKVYYDYYLSIVAKTLLWVAPCKASTIIPLPQNPMAGVVELAAPPARISCGKFTIPAGDPLTCQLALRDLFGTVTALPAQPARPGTFELLVDLPRLPHGDYFLDYRFVAAKGTEYWGSYGVTVNTPTTINSIVPAKPRFALTEPFRATITLSQPPAHKLILRASAFDRDEREIFRKSLPVTQQTITLEAELSRCVGMAHYLRVELWDGARCADVARQDFLVAGKDPAYPNVLFGGPSISTILGQFMADQLRRAGFTITVGYDPFEADRYDMLDFDYLIALRFPTPSVKDPDCGFTNPKWTADYIAKNITEPVKKKKDGGVYYYSLGDENGYSYTREKIAPSELQAFDQYLQDTYKGDLALLNREWGSQYPRFDAIPATDIQQQLGTADIPRKHLWMSFCEKQYADAHHALSAEIKKIDPAARVGAEGSQPGNLEWTLDGLEMWGPYPSRLDNALMRSFGNPHLLKGNWWGGYDAMRSAKGQPLWDQMLSGGVNGNFYFTADGAEGLLGCDLSYADFFEQDQLPVIREMTDKLGPLLNKTPVATMGVGLLYSLPSEHAQTIDTRFGAVGSTRDGLLKFCEETGISSFFYSETGVLAGKLQQDKVRLLILPQTLCLSDAAAAALRRWLADGGVLMADQYVGLRNERGALREQGALDDLFGVRQTPAGDPRTALVATTLAGVPVQWDHLLIDAGVQPTTSQAAARVENNLPVMMTNQVGKGRAILLNLPLGKIIAGADDDPAARAFLLALMKDAGIFTGLQAPSGYQVTRFRGNGYELLSCRIGTGAKDGETLELGQSCHVYDVRKGKYLGLLSAITPSACSGRNNLFTLLPAPACDFMISMPHSLPAGEIATVNIAPQPAAGHGNPERLFRMRLLGPDGAELETLRTFISGQDRPVTIHAPLAMNQQPGAYTCEVLDILTGTIHTRRFQVKGGK